jgi:hypothetical protein
VGRLGGRLRRDLWGQGDHRCLGPGRHRVRAAGGARATCGRHRQLGR